MAGSSSSISHSESASDTYIPEYSETPILQEIALHARAMSDYVYNWGMERFNKNQGDIDSLMRDALSYASPQRIAVDMGMAEAGVQQAAERGRLSAIRDLESYGIDPSSGRYAALDMSNRVMSAAAAAGAGNQQRMADQAAGNAMRNQAMAAGLQNAQFGLGVGDSANRFLQTASSLKYPPLGRWSTSVSDSKSESVQTDPGGGGSKGGGDKQPQQQQAKDGGGGKEPKPAAQKPQKPPAPPKVSKPPPKAPTKPTKPDESKPEEFAKDPYFDPGDYQGDYSKLDGEPQSGMDQEFNPWPNEPQSGMDQEFNPWPNQEPQSGMDQEFDPWASNPNAMPTEDTPPDTQPGGAAYPGAETPTGMDMEFDPWANTPDQTPGPETPVGYDPYSENIQRAAFDPQQAIDPETGLPADQTEVTDADPAGALYGLDPSGWTLDTDQPLTMTDADGDFTGDGTLEFGADQPEGQVYDATYDSWTDDPNAGLELTDYGDTGDDSLVTDAGGDEYGNIEYDFGDTGDYTYDYADQDFGDYDYGDYDYGDDYYEDSGYEYTDDFNEEDYDYGDESWEDYADEDYADEDYDYGDDSWEDYADDEGDDSWDDSGELEDAGEIDYGDDTSDWTDGGDDGGDYARGGPVRKRRRRMATGFRPRPQRFARGGGVPGMASRPGQMPGMARPGQMPGRPAPMPGRRRDPPPVPPQPPRPPRGMPMPARGGPRPAPMRTGMNAMPPGNMISANGMPPPTMGGMPRPQRLAQGGPARGPNPQHATSGGFVSRELSPSGGSKVDDVQARLNAEEFVIPKDVAMWKGKEFFYKMIAQARKNRSGEGNSPGQQNNSPSPQNNSPSPRNNSPRPRTGYGAQR